MAIDENVPSTFSCASVSRDDMPPCREPADMETVTLAAADPPQAPVGTPARLGWLLFWMSGTLTSFIIAAVSVRALAHNLNAFEMMSVRSAGGIAILLMMGLARPQLLRSVTIRQMR